MKFIDYILDKKSKDLKLYVDPCSGNNGDLLIWEGMKEVLRKADPNIVSTPDEADVIIVNGGGMFIDAYKQGLTKLETYSKDFPDKPLCFAPGSYYFEKVDFSSYLTNRKTELTLFCREKYSKEYIDKVIKEKSNVVAYLDHDLAFNLEGSEFIREIQERHVVVKGKVLVVDRMDVENAKTKGKDSFVKLVYMTIVPNLFKEKIRKARFKKRAKYGSDLTSNVKNYLQSMNISFSKKDLYTGDISRVDLCTFDEFIEHIATSEYIFTNRLHVGVLGHLLKRKVYMLEGSYHKMTGIYEYSMSESPLTNKWLGNEA